MLQQPSVSVIIATYNRSHYLAQTIDSVLSQRFRSFELIVVDDGSTDNTRELLRRYGDRLRFYCQENRGPSAARNLGVRHARGEWIAIQDSAESFRGSVRLCCGAARLPDGFCERRLLGPAEPWA